MNCWIEVVHWGPKFDHLRPPSRDGIWMPKLIWATDEIYDCSIDSLRIRKFGLVRRVVSVRRVWIWTKIAYSKRINRIIIKFRRESQWNKLISACICRHVMQDVVDQTWDRRLLVWEIRHYTTDRTVTGCYIHPKIIK